MYAITLADMVRVGYWHLMTGRTVHDVSAKVAQTVEVARTK